MSKIIYKKLGLVNTTELFKKAIQGGYAIPAYNFSNMEQLQAIITACVETNSPVILQVTEGARKYANQLLLRHMAIGAVEMARGMGSGIPVCLHLDHGNSWEVCRSCVDSGFSSVMFDGSFRSYQENVKITKQIVEYAHQFDVSVEGELGVLAGVEDEISSQKSIYTKPEEVKDFIDQTGVDSLAVAIGTSHGAYKFKLKPGEASPSLRFDILEEIKKIVPGFPIVLHGASSVPQEYVEIIDKYGGQIENAIGIPEEQIREAAKSAVCKVNIDSDSRLVMTAVIRRVMAEQPKEFDPRKYLGSARDELVKFLKNKNKNILGSANRA